jgi:anti-sigma B factor antagonist
MPTEHDITDEPTYEVESSDSDDVRIVDVRGEIDLAAAPELSEHLLGAEDAGRRAVVVDLCRVTFLDSSGLAALLNARKKLLAADIPMVVACEPDGRPARVMEVTGLRSVLDLAGSREEALAAATSRNPS